MRRRLAAVPLRVALVVALVALAALGLLASGVAVTTALEKSLLSRADEELGEAVRTFARPRQVEWFVPPDGNPPFFAPVDGRRGPPGPPPPPPFGQPRRFFERMWNQHGELTRPPGDGDFEHLPDVPTVAPPPSPGSGLTIALRTVNSADGQERWRLVTASNEYGVSLVGLPLTDNEDTVGRLIWLQTAIGAMVLALLGVAGFFVVRGSLRPLRAVENTAKAIADGDLHRRVPWRGTTTEVDRLAQALNVMLAQIQHGIAATEASEEAARTSEQRMRRFIADASHELRTPLTTIRGFAELYRQGAVTDPSMLLDRIESESARMGLLVEDLLMLARMDAQRPLDREPVDLLALAGEAVHNARALSAKKGAPDRVITLDVVDGVGTLEVVGDAARLAQILSNLLSNAITHTPPEATVTVRLLPSADLVRMEVVDTGPGLSPDAAQRVFERFYRTDASRTRTSGGTGLGLSIVQALVKAHHGHVWAEGAEGTGTTFIVELPR